MRRLRITRCETAQNEVYGVTCDNLPSYAFEAILPLNLDPSQRSHFFMDLYTRAVSRFILGQLRPADYLERRSLRRQICHFAKSPMSIQKAQQA